MIPSAAETAALSGLQETPENSPRPVVHPGCDEGEHNCEAADECKGVGLIWHKPRRWWQDVPQAKHDLQHTAPVNLQQRTM